MNDNEGEMIWEKGVVPAGASEPARSVCPDFNGTLPANEFINVYIEP
jgi:hypothetical protein